MLPRTDSGAQPRAHARRWPTVAEARRHEDFQSLVNQLAGRYGTERVEQLVAQLGIEPWTTGPPMPAMANMPPRCSARIGKTCSGGLLTLERPVRGVATLRQRAMARPRHSADIAKWPALVPRGVQFHVQPSHVVCRRLVARAVVPYVLLDKNLSQTARAQLNRLLGRSEEQGASGLLADVKLPWSAGEDASAGAGASAHAAQLRSRWRKRFASTSRRSGSPAAGRGSARCSASRSSSACASPSCPARGEDDVAGSLTYYFDDHHQLQRITFFGVTGNEQRLLALLVNTYRLKTSPTTGVARYVAGSESQPTSCVTVRHLPVVRADASLAKVEVAVDLRRGDLAKAARTHGTVALPQAYRPW